MKAVQIMCKSGRQNRLTTKHKQQLKEREEGEELAANRHIIIKKLQRFAFVQISNHSIESFGYGRFVYENIT